MAIIISNNGKNARKVEHSPVKEEYDLQRYVSDNPDSLPLDEIKEGVKLLVVGREFSTASGPIDVLAVDGDGDIYIIETKLFKNPDKRLVVAQMLDYGAAMWKSYGLGDEFLADIEESLATSGGTGGLNQRLVARYELDEQGTEDVRNAIKRNLADGNIKFVVLMNQLHERLRNLILFINQKSRFNIYAVEMEFYFHEGMDIVIPKLFGAEGKKDVGIGPGATPGKKFGSEDAFFASIEDESAKATFKKLLNFGDDLKATRFLGTSGISVKLPDPRGSKKLVTLFVMDRYGDIYFGWSRQQVESLGLPTDLATGYTASLAALFPGVTPDPKHSDSLSRELKAKEVEQVFGKFKAVVSHFVQNVRAGIKE